MATKGPLNMYGTKSGKPDDKINYAYAHGLHRNWEEGGSHYDKHLSDSSSTTSKDHIDKANEFANNIDIVYNDSFVSKDGITFKYSRQTKMLVLVDKNGYVVSYYRKKYKDPDKAWERLKEKHKKKK